ncbi:hypothetical protein FPZ42_03615 [Mucilaginibacter achroorhodeus]|uniref:Carboxypeptidase-like regulatory domain-containing protein n=1 Tax=Mucilaginibacter achroorhodeus TaxID=2599294 RepID=A0A563UAE4_9SPHI|nr:hypothetical protein [Mucilaginibacter achroorhodeus]TWR28314.1 hypothetical protein FPZ42_03615 [Mucilaginibacter achroorhodeus]
MHFRFLSFLIILLCISVVAGAQTGVIKGVIYKRISSERLNAVAVTNIKTNVFVMSDDLGNFSISAMPGDTLEFTKKGFTPQKQAASPYGGLVVYMQPSMELAEVKVVGQTKKQELNEVMKDYRKQGTFYNGKPPVLTMLTNPITGLYELFGKTPGRAKRFAAYQKKELEASEVDRRYNRPFIMRVTGEADSTKVLQFMNFYRPSFEDLKQWGDYDLIKHTKIQWEYFQKNGGKDRLQKLY